MTRVTYNATDCQEPDNDPSCFTKVLDVASRNTVPITQMLLDKLQTHKQIEDSRNANGPKESHENGLSDFFNLVDPPVHAKHPRQTSQEEYQKTKNDEAPC